MKKLYHTITLSLLLLLIGEISFAQTASDSLVKKSPAKKSVIKSTVRIHSKGMFNFGGRICTDNPAVDINFIYDRKQWGLLAFKAFDLVDHTSPNNFSLIVLYKNFKLGKRLTFTPNIGTILEQTHSFADHGSDAVIIAITAFKLSPHLTIDHTALFGNLLFEPDFQDWVNRIRLLYSQKHVDVTATLWHNNQVLDEAEYASCALTIAYSRIKLSNHLNASLSVTDLGMITSSDEESVPKGNKIMFTAAIQFVR
jgi:hypothetical protein